MFKFNERFVWGVKEAFIKKRGAENWTSSKQTYPISLTKVSEWVFTKPVSAIKETDNAQDRFSFCFQLNLSSTEVLQHVLSKSSRIWKGPLKEIKTV